MKKHNVLQVMFNHGMKMCNTMHKRWLHRAQKQLKFLSVCVLAQSDDTGKAIFTVHKNGHYYIVHRLLQFDSRQLSSASSSSDLHGCLFCKHYGSDQTAPLVFTLLIKSSTKVHSNICSRRNQQTTFSGG